MTRTVQSPTVGRGTGGAATFSLVFACVLGGVGCIGDIPDPPIPLDDPSNVIWTVGPNGMPMAVPRPNPTTNPTGTVGGTAGMGGGSSTGGGGPNIPLPPMAGSGGTTVPPVATPTRVDACKAGPGRPMLTWLRRLSNSEYQRTVRDLLGAPAAFIDRVVLPDQATLAGFNNNVEFQLSSAAHVERYAAAARLLAGDLMSSAMRRTQMVGCDPAGAGRAACLRKFAETFGRRVYRRPLTTAEIDELAALGSKADTDADPWAGPRIMLEGMLQSPDFLFISEIGTSSGAKPGTLRLTGYEMATRLAFLITGSTPDDALLDKAKNGMLDAIPNIVQTAGELLSSPKAIDRIAEFQEQWLGIDDLPTVQKDPMVVRGWSDALRDSMFAETSRVLRHLATRPTGSYLDFLTGKRTFLDARMATHYGAPKPAVDWTEVDAPAERIGVLTHASIMTMTNKSQIKAAPIHRGLFVRERILCEHPQEAPDVVPMFPTLPPGVSERQGLSMHASNAACAGCHRFSDEVGFGFARYDEIGRIRAADSTGARIDVRGTVVGFTPPEFNGAAELIQKLSQSWQVQNCVAKHYFRFASGYEEKKEDECTIQKAEESFARGGFKFRDLVLGLVQTESFQSRPL